MALSICIAGGSIVVSPIGSAFWLFDRFTGATEAKQQNLDHDETILGTVGAIVEMVRFQLLG